MEPGRKKDQLRLNPSKATISSIRVTPEDQICGIHFLAIFGSGTVWLVFWWSVALLTFVRQRHR